MKTGLLIHIPHASLYIPPAYQDTYLLAPEALAAEAYWSADIYCDELFDTGAGVCITASHSRLVCDVERFRDDAMEPMALKGNGLFYTHTGRGEPLRGYDPLLREKVLAEIYDPHHARLTQAVDDILSRYEYCLIIDGHSFGEDKALGDNLPDFCVGTDAYHTPGFIEEAAHTAFRSLGYSTETNYPYAGAITPFKHYQKEKRVFSLMIEVNKRLYVKENRVDKTDDFARVKEACHGAVGQILASANGLE